MRSSLAKAALLLGIGVFGLSSCGAPRSPLGAHPAGWLREAGPKATLWHKPGDPAQTFRVEKLAFTGSLKALASQTTTNILLQRPGSRFTKSVPFAPCPGEAGVLSFRDQLPDAKPGILEVGFSVQETGSILTFYLRPASTPEDPAVTGAMKDALCYTVL